jgi:hypothetical protein
MLPWKDRLKPRIAVPDECCRSGHQGRDAGGNILVSARMAMGSGRKMQPLPSEIEHQIQSKSLREFRAGIGRLIIAGRTCANLRRRVRGLA